MAYKLHMNGVMTGSLNAFCLVCHSFLKTEFEANEHIGTAPHKTNLVAVQYSDKFGDEHIRKFKGGYYCEFCNVLMPIAAKITLHLTEIEHKQNKDTLLLKPKGNNVVALNDVLIDGNSWHGLVEGICSVCNVEFDNENEHKSDPNHFLNLVLKPVKFGAGNVIYRHLDDSAVLCLTCNKLLAPCKMNEHYDATEHQELYAKCVIVINVVAKQIESNQPSPVEEDKKHIKSKTDNNYKNIKTPSAEEKSKILGSIAEFQSKGININLETDTAFCKKCSKVITFECKEIENHIENHSPAEVDSELLYPSKLDQNLNRVNINDKSTKKSGGSDTDAVSNSDSKNDVSNVRESLPTQNNNEKCEKAEAKVFAKENKLTYNEDIDQAYCRICKVKLPSSLKSMKEHVAGAAHTKLAANKTTEPKPFLVKQETQFFVDSSYEVTGFLTNEILINKDFCLPKLSFWLISRNDSGLRCILCEVTLPPFTEMDLHTESDEHANKMAQTPVIISEKFEFIREIRPELFHCGFCNLVVSGWNEMKQHLECFEHRFNREQNERRLRIHLPQLQTLLKERERMDIIRLLSFFNRLG